LFPETRFLSSLEKSFALMHVLCGGFSPVLLGHSGQSLDLFHVQSKPLGHPTIIVLVCFEENSRLAHLYALLSLAKVAHDIPDEMLLIRFGHDFAVEISSLDKIIVGMGEGMTTCLS
jgi:hypothetical protein